MKYKCSVIHLNFFERGNLLLLVIIFLLWNILILLMHIFSSKKTKIFYSFFCKTSCCRIFLTYLSFDQFIKVFIILTADYSHSMHRNNFSANQKNTRRKLSWHNTLCSTSGRIKTIKSWQSETNTKSFVHFSRATCIVFRLNLAVMSFV